MNFLIWKYDFEITDCCLCRWCGGGGGAMLKLHVNFCKIFFFFASTLDSLCLALSQRLCVAWTVYACWCFFFYILHLNTSFGLMIQKFTSQVLCRIHLFFFLFQLCFSFVTVHTVPFLSSFCYHLYLCPPFQYFFSFIHSVLTLILSVSHAKYNFTRLDYITL